MAEGDSASAGADGDGSQQIGGIKLTNDIIFGQSKSESSKFVQFKDLEDVGSEKNKLYLVCLHCNCKIMAPGYATLVKKQIFLPDMASKYSIGSEPSGDTPTHFWLVIDMFHFDNVGFSNTINGREKYLICADCEVGPIGWHDTQNRQEYFVAAERVQYATD